MRVKVNFYFEQIKPVDILPAGFLSWLQSVAKQYQKRFQLNYIFCSDDYLLQINQKHLDHDYYTDIITFDLSSLPNRIESDIYISIDRVNDNAQQEMSSFADELMRVMAHGVFHLLGFLDKTEHEALIMRGLENSAIAFMKNVSRET